MMLKKHETILEWDREEAKDSPSGDLYFSKPIEEENQGIAVHLLPEIWEDMGRPESITVIVRPGDHLNK